VSAILGIDAGTTGVSALVVDADGRLLGRGYRELTSYVPNPDDVDHDPDEIFHVALGAAREGAVRARQAEWQRAIDTALAWAAGSELDRAHRTARRRRPRRASRPRR